MTRSERFLLRSNARKKLKFALSVFVLGKGLGSIAAVNDHKRVSVRKVQRAKEVGSLEYRSVYEPMTVDN